MSVLILVVDDETDMEELFRQQFRRDLRSGRFEMEFASSAPQALEVVQRSGERDIILLLSDINMPGMSGLEMLLKVKAVRPDLPVIMITSRIAQKHRDHAAQLGVEHYLGKPYSEEKLLALITQCMSQQTEAQGA